MTELRIYSESDGRLQQRCCRADMIKRHLAAIGAAFERLPVAAGRLDPDAHQDEVIEAHRELLDSLMQRHGFAAMDVLTVDQNHPRSTELRREFLREHTHSGVEGRLFVHGTGLFYLRTKGRVYGVLCQRGDFITMPARISHWFDMGRAPDFRSIRLFASAEGWESVPTGSDVSRKFPTLETYLSAA